MSNFEHFLKEANGNASGDMELSSIESPATVYERLSNIYRNEFLAENWNIDLLTGHNLPPMANDYQAPTIEQLREQTKELELKLTALKKESDPQPGNQLIDEQDIRDLTSVHEKIETQKAKLKLLTSSIQALTSAIPRLDVDEERLSIVANSKAIDELVEVVETRDNLQSINASLKKLADVN